MRFYPDFHPLHFQPDVCCVSLCPSTVLRDTRGHFLTFYFQKTKPLKAKNTLYLRASAVHSPFSDLNQIKRNDHQNNSQILSRTLVENHWKIRQIPFKKPVIFGKKNHWHSRIVVPEHSKKMSIPQSAFANPQSAILNSPDSQLFNSGLRTLDGGLCCQFPI
jgi:hypothetical protein